MKDKGSLRMIQSLRSTWATVIAVVALGSWSPYAAANCGLDMCPMPQSVEKPSALRPIALLRWTSVGDQGTYEEVMIGASYGIQNRVHLGFQAPLVWVQQDGNSVGGFGNIVAFGSWSMLERPSELVLDLGLQLEIPTVTDPALGDGHFLLLPTLQMGWHPSQWIAMAVLGWGQTLDDHHHHHSAASIVNPHQNQELLLRVDLGARLPTNGWRGTVRLDGIQPFGHHGPAATILTLGPTLGYSGRRGTVEAFGLVPLTDSRRYEVRSGLRMSLLLP